MESGSKHWIFNCLLPIIFSLFLQDSSICELLEECIFIDHAFVEFWLMVSILPELLYFICLVVKSVVNHLVELLKLIVILVDFSFKFSKQCFMS